MITTPCRENPAAWDLPAERGAVRARLADLAADRCQPCPLFEACEWLATERPPQHDCVQAGLVWINGHPMTPQAFWARETRPLREVRTCALAGCDEQFEARSKEHRYCSKGHRDRVKNTPDGKVATVVQPKVCALDGCQVSFTPVRGRHRFCTPSCQQESRRREEAKRQARAKRRERDETAARLVGEGNSLRSVAAQLGVPYTTVHRAVNGARAAA